MPPTKKNKQGSKETEAANSKRRNRVPISCTICRRRKVKCDKRRPVCAGCEKTGVAHLCHYIDPPWAQPLSNDEINPNTPLPVQTADQAELIEKLKEKIKILETKLMKDGSISSPTTSVYDDDFNEQETNGSEDPNEPLNLGKKFDMLHIKTTTTVHLGATSWLAIMKGDPYLRVLWAHIFKLRKQAEELKFRKQSAENQHEPSDMPAPSLLNTESAASPTSSSANELPLGAKCPVSGKDLSQGKCPVIHSRGKCPVVHHPSSGPIPVSEESSNSIPSTCPVSGRSQASGGRCPVSHLLDHPKKRSRENSLSNTEEAMVTQDAPAPDEEKVCPLMIGDNSFLKRFKPNSAEADSKKKKRSNANGSTKQKNDGKNVKPEDFKQDPIGMMHKFLPEKKVLWMLIDRFFEVLYVYMPFVDKNSFKEEVRFIFGDRNDKDQGVKLRIRSGVDFALVGTVCIILRLTWCTLPKNNLNKLLKKPTTAKTYQEKLEALDILQKPENEIPLELVDCVKHCFSNMKLMRRSSLIIVQCALYMRLYFIYSPEDGDGADGGESQVFLGMIIQMAISIGLHRDPKNFENFSNERQRHLWRKIWYELVSLDIELSMNLGCPRCLQNFEEFSDTRLPGQLENDLDIQQFKDDVIELTVIKNIHMRYNSDKLLARTMKVLLNVNQPAKKHDIDQLIDDLQRSMDGFGVTKDRYALPQLGKILVNRYKAETLASSATRALEFRLHVLVNMLIYLLNYIMFVHFEPKSSQDPQSALLARQYAQRALDCALEGYRNCTLFFDCGLDYFGPGVDLILTPLLLLVGHRSVQFMVSLILRSRCGPYMKPNYVSSDGQANTMDKFVGSVNIENGFQNIENSNHDLNVEIKDTQSGYSSMFNVDVNSGELLATILLAHMDKFHILSEALGEKYQYSWRMSKAVAFFITLLRKPINTVKNIVKTENVKHIEENTGISSVLNSVPLALSSAEENSLAHSKFDMGADSKSIKSISSTQQQSSISQGSPFTKQSENFTSPMYTGVQYGANVMTPDNGIGQFSISFNGSDPNPINTIDVNGQDQFPELIQATESFANFDEKSFGDLFGMGQNGSSSNAGNSVFLDVPEFIVGTNVESSDNSINDYNTMLTGSWFS